MNLADRVKTLTPSSTLAISAKAKELKKQGHDVIGLGVGEPDFNTPEYIIKAAEQAMHNGMTKYTPSGGIPELKEAIINKFKEDNELSYSSDYIISTKVAKPAFYNLFQVLVNECDEVFILAPYCVSYTVQVNLAGQKPVIVKALVVNYFKVSPDQLEKVITEKTKAVV